jgi:hypothetical protein
MSCLDLQIRIISILTNKLTNKELFMKHEFIYFLAFTATIGSLSTANANQSMIEVGANQDVPIEVRLNNGTFQTRYRYETNDSGAASNNAIQYQILFDVTLAFFQDHVLVNFEGRTGSSFTGGWDSVGYPTGSSNLSFFIRTLSMTLSPKSGLDLTFGSMKPEYGIGSENTYIDADGYVMGYRARVALEKDYVTVTTGYLGDLKNPNVFTRLDHMDDFNYLQVLFTHAMGEIVRSSFDYSQVGTEKFARIALKFDVAKWAGFLDSVVLEDMSTLGGNPVFANIFAAKLSKRFKDVIADRDLATAMTYIYQSNEQAFSSIPLGDKSWNGHSIRVNVNVPDLMVVGSTPVGMFLDWVQNITDLDRFRAELGMFVKF